MEFRDAGDGVQQLVLGNGTSILLPATAVVLPHLILNCEVAPGDPVADLLPRDHYTWEEFKAKVNLPLAYAEFLYSNAIPPGVGGYDGNEVLLDEAYVCEAAKKQALSGVGRLDISNMLPYTHESGDYIVGPAIRMSDWDDFFWEAHGVIYNSRPS